MLGFVTFKAPYWEILGFSEIAAVATNLYTGWPLFEFEPLLKFEEPSHILHEEISSVFLKLAEEVQ